MWEQKAVITGKFIALHKHNRKQERSEVNNLLFYLEKVRKEEQK